MNGIICFSVRFCDNSLLVLKILFFRMQKCTMVFQWKEDINVVVIYALSSTKACLSFVKFQFLAKTFGETFIMSLKSTLIPKELWYKLFISQEKQIKRNLTHGFVDKTAKDNNAKTNISTNITLCLFSLQS